MSDKQKTKGRADPEEAFKLQNEEADIEPEERLDIDQVKRIVRRLTGGKAEDEEDGGARKKREAGDEEDEEEEEEGFQWDDGVCPLPMKPATEEEEEEVYYEDDLYPSRYILENASQFFDEMENMVFEVDPTAQT